NTPPGGREPSAPRWTIPFAHNHLGEVTNSVTWVHRALPGARMGGSLGGLYDDQRQFNPYPGSWEHLGRGRENGFSLDGSAHAVLGQFRPINPSGIRRDAACG